jgi:hypothetical protein
MVAVANRELQFEIVSGIMRRCICSESTARFFLKLRTHNPPVSRAPSAFPLQRLGYKADAPTNTPHSKSGPPATDISREYAISTRQFSGQDCQAKPVLSHADLTGHR